MRVRRPVMIGAWALAAAAAAALLVGFGQVLGGAVEQGELRRRASAQHWDALWRCNALRGQDQREACRARESPAPAAPPSPTDAPRSPAKP